MIFSKKAAEANRTGSFFEIILKRKSRKLSVSGKEEASTGFEPVDTGVADHCLTTWLRRHMTPTGIEPVIPP